LYGKKEKRVGAGVAKTRAFLASEGKFSDVRVSGFVEKRGRKKERKAKASRQTSRSSLPTHRSKEGGRFRSATLIYRPGEKRVRETSAESSLLRSLNIRRRFTSLQGKRQAGERLIARCLRKG